jgi:hypothetical protein
MPATSRVPERRRADAGGADLVKSELRIIQLAN